jgi:hypothetical protein
MTFFMHIESSINYDDTYLILIHLYLRASAPLREQVFGLWEKITLVICSQVA